MERAEIERMAAAEDRMWWYRALHANLVAAADAIAPTRKISVLLDAGCGTGGLLGQMARRAPQTFCFGIELDRDAAFRARDKSACAVIVGSVGRLPIAPGALDAIVSADVLCQAGVDVAGALGEFHAGLGPGGRLILNLPAYPWLYSAHDRAVGNARRFTRAALRGFLRQAGFVEIQTWYWNSLLFPLMLIHRLTTRGQSDGPRSDVEPMGIAIEALFGRVAAVELWLSKKGLRLPFGGSILAVAAKP